MQALARDGLTAEQVRVALHGLKGARSIRFRYELLDSANRKIGDLYTVESGRVSYNAANQIKRTAQFAIRETGEINWLSDRIKPYCRVGVGNGWAEFPLGVFLLSSPYRVAAEGDVVIREVEAYDLLQVLTDDRVSERHAVSAGTNYIAAVGALLDSAGFPFHNLAPTAKVLPADRDWPMGTAKLHIANDLLKSINYTHLWVDEDGNATAQAYISPALRASEYTYRTDHESVIFAGARHGRDLFAVPNTWLLAVSESDRAELTSSYTNTNPLSPTSTVSRGRTIAADPYPEFVDAADQASLDGMVARRAFEASQVSETVDFETAVMPQHSHQDVITLEHSVLGITAKFREAAWEFDLAADARMRHTLRRVVPV